MAGVMERRTGPRKLPIPDSVAPATRWNPLFPGVRDTRPGRDRFVRSAGPAPPLPKRDEDIAFAPVTRLSRWIETRALTSDRLTRIYLDRIARFDSKVKSIAGRFDKLTFKYTGPWPPYNFVNIRLKLERA